MRDPQLLCEHSDHAVNSTGVVAETLLEGDHTITDACAIA